ncbi:MAG: hypothetical protein ACO3ST_02500 [Burkholderiaceae bacterium]
MPEPQDNQKPWDNQKIWSASINLISHLLLDVPATVGELIWRIFSVTGLTGLLIAAFLVWRYPGEIKSRIEGSPDPSVAAVMLRNPLIERRVMELVSSFVYQQRPARFALVSWPTATTGQLVWANGKPDEWPVSMNGILSQNLVPAVGPMVFGECWDGELNQGEQWHLCPLSNQEDVWGFLIAHWPQGSKTGPRALDHLAERIESLLY